MPQVSSRVRNLLLVIIALLALVFLWLNFLFVQRETPKARRGGSDDPAWREVMNWDFAVGEHPAGWGWGSRRLRDGCLELSSGPDGPAVFIIPVEHAADFVLSAEVMLPAGETGKPARVHLMTRDGGGTNHVSGGVLWAGSDSMSVYHRVNRQDYLRDIVPTAVRLEAGRWHRLRLTSANGGLALHLDGTQVFRAAGPYPPGLYSEPYLAAEGGTVRLRHVQLLQAAAAGVENLAGGGRGD